VSDTPGHRLFAALYDPVMALPERVSLPPHRRYLVDGLSGRVLDVGAGTGANFPYLAERAREADLEVHAIEPDRHMRERAREAASEAGLTVDIRDAGAEWLPYADDYFDAAVAGIVFCTISDPGAALDELARVLRPGGELRFLEHVAATGYRARLQRLVEPVWKPLAGGCHVTRDTVGLFAAHDAFDVVEVERIGFGLFPADPFVRGTLVRRGD
jgi:SAM-dependent methyltransferase